MTQIGATNAKVKALGVKFQKSHKNKYVEKQISNLLLVEELVFVQTNDCL